MEGYDREFWQFSDTLRLQTAAFSGLSLGDSIWSPATTADRRNNNNNDLLPADAATAKNNGVKLNDAGPGLIGSGKLAFGGSKADRYNNLPLPTTEKAASVYNNNGGGGYAKNNNNNAALAFNKMGSYGYNSNGNGSGNNNSNSGKTLPAAEALPRGQAIGGYIFVCNNETMDENLRRELFGLPSRYRESVRAIRPGLPLFLYNYSTHQLHGIFEAASFGGTNIDPTAWEDKKCPGESRFPAQVRVATRKIYDPLEEDAFRPILHHYDGPKFRLELSVTEALALLDIFADKDDA